MLLAPWYGSQAAPAAAQTEATAPPDIRALADVRSRYRQAEVPPRFIPLAPGAVRPLGWLRDWADTSARGFAGHLDDRHIVFRKAWTGEDFKSKGSAGRGLRWPLEQSAYWLDALVRLAYIVDDAELKKIAHDRLDIVVDGVNNKGGETFIWWEPAGVLKVDGGDERFDRFTRNFNNWAHAHMGRALVAYYRASGDPRILKALSKVYATYPLPDLPKDRFVPHGGATNLDPMLETYALSGDQRILDNAIAFANSDNFRQLAHEWATEPELPDGHTVLYYEHARVPAVTFPWTGNKEALAASKRALDMGLERHGLPVGLASGQEHLMGTGAIRGLETCTAAASAWTNKWMLQVTGHRQYADQMERAVLNAGAAAISRDFDTACYFQTLNRIDGVVPVHVIKDIEGYAYSKTAGPTLCCIGNATRLIPDYVQHLWMATLDKGLAATLYGPGTVTSFVGEKATPVRIESATHYPFDNDVVMTVLPGQAVNFPLYVRIPTWVSGPATVKVNGEAISTPPDESGFVRIDRTWNKGDTVAVNFPLVPRMEVGRTTAVPDIPYYKQPNRATPITTVKNDGFPFASVHYGPLLFALAQPDETPNKARPGAEWQFALDVSPQSAATQIEPISTDVPKPFQWQLDAPLKLRVPAVVFDWKPTNTEPLPSDPIKGGDEKMVTLVPYGVTKFRISMFPVTQKTLADTDAP